ncbi:MAG: universal stress protein [Caldilineaceae bacterium]
MFKRVLIPLDGSPFAEKVLVELPRFIEPGKSWIELVGVLEVSRYAASVSEYGPLRAIAEIRAQYEAYFLKMRQSLQEKGYLVNTAIVEGDAAEEIINNAVASEADLIAMTTHGRSGIARWTLGSVADRIIHNTSLPVLLVRSQTDARHEEIKSILVPLDGSELSEKALPYAATLAKEHHAQLRLIQAVSPSDIEYAITRLPTQSETDRALQRRFTLSDTYLSHVAGELRSAGIKVETNVLLGDPARCVVDEAEKQTVDLIVISTHGRTGFSRWVHGSVANHVIRSVSVPLLVIRGLETQQEASDQHKTVGQ